MSRAGAAVGRGGDPVRLAGWLATGAGLTVLAAVTYLFTVLVPAGLTIDMFDNPTDLLPWIADHPRLYQGLWLLYFLSQALLLAVPWLLGAAWCARVSAVVGSTAVILAMVGLAVLLAASPVTAAAYRQAAGAGSLAQSIVTVHTVAADIGKDLRLLSEILLGVWLLLLGDQIRRRGGRRTWWMIAALGGWTTLVAGWKLVRPDMPLEDWLAFLLAVGYLGLGLGLLRAPRPG